MSIFTEDEVIRLAGLSRIALTDEQVARFTKELDAVGAAVAQVSDVVDEDTPATSHPIPLTNVLRKDVVGQVVDRDEVLAAAPESEDGQFKVPQILGEE